MKLLTLLCFQRSSKRPESTILPMWPHEAVVGAIPPSLVSNSTGDKDGCLIPDKKWCPPRVRIIAQIGGLHFPERGNLFFFLETAALDGSAAVPGQAPGHRLVGLERAGLPRANHGVPLQERLPTYRGRQSGVGAWLSSPRQKLLSKNVNPQL